MTSRPLTRTDAAALAALLAAAEQLDDTGVHYSAEDIAEELTMADADLPRTSLGRFDGGELVGYLRLLSPDTPEQPRPVQAEGVVHPAHRGRGLGAELLDWAVRRSAELWPGPLTVRVTLTEQNAAGARLLGRRGFTEVRRFHDMECALPHPVPVALPAGTTLTGYRTELDEPLRLARNTAFAEHWGSLPRDPEQWREHTTGTRAFRPGLTSVLLDADEQIVAYLICHAFADADTVWVANIGTLPAWRGRGAASALLAHTLTEAPAHGHRKVALSVDTGNATGALAVYRRAGFGVVRSSPVRALDLR